jgi:hypothetical protein
MPSVRPSDAAMMLRSPGRVPPMRLPFAGLLAVPSMRMPTRLPRVALHVVPSLSVPM